MANLRGIKQKFKKFFQTETASDEGIELLQKFILPFAHEMPVRGASVEDVLTAFFALEDRMFVYVRAKRSFTIPGKFFLCGNRPTHLYEQKTNVRKNQVMLLAVDRKEGTARLEIVKKGRELNFLLERHEFEVVKDWLEVIDEEGSLLGLGNDRVKSVERRHNGNRIIRRRPVHK